MRIKHTVIDSGCHMCSLAVNVMKYTCVYRQISWKLYPLSEMTYVWCCWCKKAAHYLDKIMVVHLSACCLCLEDLEYRPNVIWICFLEALVNITTFTCLILWKLDKLDFYSEQKPSHWRTVSVACLSLCLNVLGLYIFMSYYLFYAVFFGRLCKWHSISHLKGCTVQF